MFDPVVRLILAVSAPLLLAIPAARSDDSPLKPGEHTVELNGMKLWYKVAGEGPVCVMPTPAWGPSSDLYFRTLGALEKTFTIVYLDSRGTGKSGRAKTEKEYTWDHLVADLEALRGHLKQDKVWLMGHSEGGEQVLHYAVAHPDRVAGLVLLNTAAAENIGRFADVAERAGRRKKEAWYDDAIKGMQRLRTPPKSDDELADILKAGLPLYWSDPKKIEQFQEHFAAATYSAAAMRGQGESKRTSFDLTDKLKVVTAPALIVVGDDDFVCSPVAARTLHLKLKNSKLLHIEKCGHFPWMEQPKVFAEKVPEFLDALGLPTKK